MDYSKTTIFTFEEILLLAKSCLDYINEEIAKKFEKISSSEKKLYKFCGINMDKKTYVYNCYQLMYKDVSLDDIREIRYFHKENAPGIRIANDTSDRVWGSKFSYREMLLLKGLSEKIRLEFSVKESSFFIEINLITNNSIDAPYALIKIINKRNAKIDEFHYYYNKKNLFKVVDDEELLLPNNLKNQVINNIPKFMPRCLYEYLKIKNWKIDLSEKEDEEEREIQEETFMSVISNDSSITDDTIDNKDSIKRILIKLKESGLDFGQKDKIKIPNSLFYIENTDTRKVIDPFFDDEDILKYCDLSKIDFTNADIRDFNLANTNASIDLHKVFNRDITNSNLENVYLAYQELSGIKADGANLKGTFVNVDIEKCSIIGTKFNQKCSFFIGKSRIDLKMAMSMGLDIETDSQEFQLKV